MAPLALAGLWAQIVHFLANFWYVEIYERYVVPNQPPFQLDFLFIPEHSPLLAHWRAVLAWDSRVDFWLVNVYRDFGAARTAEILVPLLLVLALCAWRLARAVRAASGGGTPGSRGAHRGR